MARTISTTPIAKDAARTVERRTRRVVIESTADGRFRLTAEREDVTWIGDDLIGAPVAAGNIVLSHDEIVGSKDFTSVVAAISGAIDAKDEAMEKAAAQSAEVAATEAAAVAAAVAVTGEAAPIAAKPA